MAGLILDITSLPRQIGSTLPIEAQFEAPNGLGNPLIAVRPGSTIEVYGTLTAVDDGVLTQVTAEVELEGSCARCLETLREDRTIDLADLYLTPEALEKQQVEEDDDVDEVFPLDGDELDLEPALRDALVLQLPFQPLCRPDCTGMCEMCGEKWDDLPADHKHDMLDPRWAALAQLATPLPEDDEQAAVAGTQDAQSATAGGTASDEAR